MSYGLELLSNSESIDGLERETERIRHKYGLILPNVTTYSNKLNKNLIEKVIFNPPATVVIYKDGSKKIVKCGENDEFSPEVGFAMAMMNEMFGSRNAYKNFIKKWAEKSNIKQGNKNIQDNETSRTTTSINSDGEEISIGDWVYTYDKAEGGYIIGKVRDIRNTVGHDEVWAYWTLNGYEFLTDSVETAEILLKDECMQWVYIGDVHKLPLR